MTDHRLLLLSGGVKAVNVTDTGAGVESITVVGSFSVADTGALKTETWSLASATIPMTDLGVGSEAVAAIIGQFLALYDSGKALDSLSIAFGGISISDSGVGAETETERITVPITDTGTGADIFALIYSFKLIDPALSVETASASPITGHVAVSDFSFAADFAFRLQGYLRLDGFDLPHVQTLRISEEPQIEDLKIQGGSLPKRSIISKMGRVVEIEGWTSSQSDIDELENMKNGAIRVFLHPSGDSFAVLVSNVQVDNNVDDYGRRSCTLTLKETRAW